MNMVMEFEVLYNVCSVLASWATGGFSRRLDWDEVHNLYDSCSFNESFCVFAQNI